MGLSINTNLSALNTYRNLNSTQNDLSKSLEKLSTGLRINRAADDASGLTISEGLKSQVGGLTVAARNAQDGISVVQTAEGGLTETHSILQRMRDLAVQAGNDSNNGTSRDAIKTEVGQLQQELTRISSSTNFNGINLLDGSNNSLKFQVGANGDKGSQISVDLSGANVAAIATKLTTGSVQNAGTSFDAALATLGTTASFTLNQTNADGSTTAKTVTTGTLSSASGTTAGWDSVQEYADALSKDANFSANFSVSVVKDDNGAGKGIVVSSLSGGTVSGTTTSAGLTNGTASATSQVGVQFDTAQHAQDAIKLIDTQIAAVSAARSNLGAIQNRFDHAINVTNVAKENLTAAQSRITDVDMAQEMVKYTRDNILSQAGTSMLAQANQSTQGVLSLLR
ncbi:MULTISPECIES: flagellin [unclassified Curtobacterium]|uniref:flagellin N-terminal helical domain-containing protein n=1 Tax=unclassified Curtobacterium TaxID=257496 RepID=UPI0008DD1B75|nr:MULTISPECIES: flagellin [unclassified Curtobacterium]WIA98309.1 flagellin [Curtobacterium sp. MCBA15_004]WIB01564.1 flagellin [Curtobacterium sp. MCBA15_012]